MHDKALVKGEAEIFRTKVIGFFCYTSSPSLTKPDSSKNCLHPPLPPQWQGKYINKLCGKKGSEKSGQYLNILFCNGEDLELRLLQKANMNLYHVTKFSLYLP